MSAPINDFLDERRKRSGVDKLQTDLRDALDPPDLLIFFGERWWPTPQDVIDEILRTGGVSKRIPADAMPTGMVKGVSRLFLAHRKCIPRELVEQEQSRVVQLLGKPSAQKGPEIREPIKLLSVFHSQGLIEKMVKYPLLVRVLGPDEDGNKVPGVFALTYFTGLRYVLPKGKALADVPEKLRGRGVQVIQSAGHGDDRVQYYTRLEDGGWEEESGTPSE